MVIEDESNSSKGPAGDSTVGINGSNGSPALPSLTGTSGTRESLKKFVPLIAEDDMTAIQKKRFNYFKQMRTFLTNMTNICERLRYAKTQFDFC